MPFVYECGFWGNVARGFIPRGGGDTGCNRKKAFYLKILDCIFKKEMSEATVCLMCSTPPPVPCQQPVPRDGPEAVLGKVDPTYVLRIVDRFHLGSPQTIAAIGGGVEGGSVAGKLCAL